VENPSNHFRISQSNHYWWEGIPSKKSVIAHYEIQLVFSDTVFIGIHRKPACSAMTSV
jgi:hypothetical protein